MLNQNMTEYPTIALLRIENNCPDHIIINFFFGGLFYFDQAELGLIYLLMALRSIGNAFHSPAMQAAIPMLAPESELMRIAGVNQALQSVSSIAGPALGALLITSLNMT